MNEHFERLAEIVGDALAKRWMQRCIEERQATSRLAATRPAGQRRAEAQIKAGTALSPATPMTTPSKRRRSRGRRVRSVFNYSQEKGGAS